MIKFFMKGVELRNPRLTRSPQIWWMYLCWCIQFQLVHNAPRYPESIRKWAFKHYGTDRFQYSTNSIRNRRIVFPDYQPKAKPLPWYIGEHALGPFYKISRRVGRWFRNQTGEYSHRCEFTDRGSGLL